MLGLVEATLGLAEAMFGLVEATLGLVGAMLGLAEAMLGLAEAMLGLAEAMLGLAEAMIGLAEAMIGLVEAMIGLVEAMLGLAEAMLGLVEAMLGLVEAADLPVWPFPFLPCPALELKCLTRARDPADSPFPPHGSPRDPRVIPWILQSTNLLTHCTSIPARIPIMPERREELHALDAVLQFVGDLRGSGDDVVHLQKTLLLGGVEGERHDQGVRQRLQSNRLDLRHLHLLGEVPEVLLRQLGQPDALRVGLGGVALDLRTGDGPHGAVRLARHFPDDLKAGPAGQDHV